jgi:A/G-specific adenine glycosylase
MLGKTRVSEDEIFEAVDVGAAIDTLSEAGINDASIRVRRFVSSIPALLEWFEDHGRQYPWRETTDPWTIYGTEILLQRTRADAVDSIYNQFFEKFETPQDLRDAPEDAIRETVRSLGFVNHRVRTLNEAADMVCDEHDGQVPESIDALKEPWRVGDYTARAVCIFAHGDSLALVDTNFARVFGRVLGYKMPNQPHKSDEVYRILDHLVPKIPDVARAYNLAILDLGALVCTPNDPNCEACPINEACRYYSEEVA